MTAEQNQEPSTIEQSQSNIGIGSMEGGSIGNGAVVAGVYNDHSVTNVIPRPEPKPIPSNVRQGSKNFVEREGDILADIHSKLQVGQRVIVCAVEGMGGVGKTELALQYAARYKQEYVAQYFLSLRETEQEKGQKTERRNVLAQAVVTLANPYLDLPESKKFATIEEQAAWFWENWLPDQGNLLVILDDAPNADSIPEQVMPNNPRVKVLVTTRERELNSSFESLSLKVLSVEKAIELLENIVGQGKVEQERATVEAICKTVGYLPLGLELLGEYLRKNRHLSFGKLQERLSLADESLSRDRKHKFYGQRGVMAAMQLSWDDLSGEARRVAMWLGLFAPESISWDLAADLGEKTGLTAAELNEARGELDRLHLIAPTDESYEFYTIHALVREFMGIKLVESEQNQPFRQGFVKGLLGIAKSMPQSPILEKIAEVTPAIPHLELLSREMLGDIENPEEDLYWAFGGVGRFYSGQGLYVLAEDSHLKCLQATQKILGDRHPDVALNMNNLAELYESQGKYEAAEPLYQQALSLYQELLGDRHPDVATSMNNLANLYRSQGKYEAAELLLEQALSLKQELLGDRHSSVASSMNNLAALYYTQGKYEAAEKSTHEALQIRQELLGDEHPDTITSFHWLATLYQAQGKYEKAELIYQRVIKLHKELLGDRHPDVAQGMNNLAALYYAQGKYEAAEPLYQQALSLRQELLGDRHPSVATSMNNLAVLRYNQNRYDESESLFLQALAIFESVLGSNHPNTQSTKESIAYLRANRPREEKN